MESWLSGLLIALLIPVAIGIFVSVILPIFSKINDALGNHPKNILAVIFGLVGVVAIIYTLIEVALFFVVMALFLFLFGNRGSKKSSKKDAHENF